MGIKIEKIGIYGDSISTVNHGCGGYEQMLSEAFGLKEIYNFAIGSSGLTKHTPNSMLSVLENRPVPEDADLFFIWHGSNDWYWGSPIREFEISVEQAVNKIRQAAPKAFLAWGTPLYRFERPDLGAEDTRGPAEAYRFKNAAGHTLLDYYLALDKASKELGFYLVDMRRLCNINRQNQDIYLEDKVHPNKAGYIKIAAVLKNEFERIMG